MARRIFLHVGTPKTGTTFLQSVVWANKDVLADQGLLLPLDRVRDHFYLSNIGRDASVEISNMPAKGKTSWQRMLDEVVAWPGDVLISHELFAMASRRRAAWSINQLLDVGDEVHTVLTARDLARQVPADWQQTIKHGRTHTLREFYGLLQSRDPSVKFWRMQDLVALMDDWSQGLPPGQAHLITVPPSGGPRGLLWQRYAGLIGIDPDSVDQSVNRPNESLGLEEIETLRRVNIHAPQGLHKPLRQMMVREVLAEGILAARPSARKFAPPADEHAWVVERGTAMVEALREIPYDIVGDLDELIPPTKPLAGPIPDDVDDTAVAAVAVETVSAVLYRTHDLETKKYDVQIVGLKRQTADLKSQLATRTKRVNALVKQRDEAWAAYERERNWPLWRQVARRVRSLGRRTPPAPRPNHSADDESR